MSSQDAGHNVTRMTNIYADVPSLPLVATISAMVASKSCLDFEITFSAFNSSRCRHFKADSAPLDKCATSAAISQVSFFTLANALRRFIAYISFYLNKQ